MKILNLSHKILKILLLRFFHLKDKVDCFENRQSERFDHLEKVVNQLKTLIVWWDEQKDD